MGNLKFKSKHPVSCQELYDWHASGGAFERLSPPWHNIEVTAWEGGRKTNDLLPHEQYGDVSKGTRVHLLQHFGPLSIPVLAEHVEHEEGVYFVDEMPRGPFAFWRHSHQFIPISEKESYLLDVIDYELPLKWITSLGDSLVQKELRRLFAFRHRQMSRDLAIHALFRQSPRRRVLVVGEDALAKKIGGFLRNGRHHVSYLSSNPSLMHGGYSWKGIKPGTFEDSMIDSVVVSSINGDAINSLQSVNGLVSAFAEKPPKSCVLVGNLPLDTDSMICAGFGAETRMVHLQVPALFEGGYLCYSERHQKNRPETIDGWCSLDDLFGGILKSIQDNSNTGKQNWCAPEAVSIEMITKRGLFRKGSPFSMSKWKTAWKYPGLIEKISANCSSPTHDWSEPELQYDYEDCLLTD